MDARIEIDYTNDIYHGDDVMEAKYRFREVVLEFNEDLTIRLHINQLDNFFKQIRDIHDEVLGTTTITIIPGDGIKYAEWKTDAQLEEAFNTFDKSLHDDSETAEALFDEVEKLRSEVETLREKIEELKSEYIPREHMSFQDVLR